MFHSVTTVHDLAWHQLKNGELLSNAEDAGLAIGVLMSTSWPRIDKISLQVVAQIEALQPGGYAEIAIP